MEPTINNVPNSSGNNPADTNTLGNSTSNNSGSVSTSPFNNSSNEKPTAPNSIQSSPLQSNSTKPIETSPKPVETTPAFMGMNNPTSYKPAPKPTQTPEAVSMPIASKPFGQTVQAPSAPSQMPKPHLAKVEFEKDSFNPEKNAFIPTETQHSSHKMLWFMIVFTVLFLALIGAGAYWYLKIYSPQMFTDQATSTDTAVVPTETFPSAVHPLTNTKPTTPVNTTTVSNHNIKVQTVTPFSASDQDKVSAYIKANINRLSPYKSSAGYTVSDITFDGPDRAIVVYGNSTRHYSAVAVAYIDSNGNVKVTSFTILEK